MALGCLEAGEQTDYIHRLTERNPQDAQEIESLVTCLQYQANPTACVSSTYSRYGLSASSVFYCDHILSLRDRWNRSNPYPGEDYAQRASAVILGDPNYRRNTSSVDRQAIADIVNETSPPLSFSQLAERLRENPEWAARLSRYSNELASDSPQTLFSGPHYPRNRRDFLRVRGFSHAIPVIRPPDSNMPWRFIENDLLIVFEMLKALITPTELHRALRLDGMASIPCIYRHNTCESPTLDNFFLIHGDPQASDVNAMNQLPTTIQIASAFISSSYSGFNDFGRFIHIAGGIEAGLRNHFNDIPLERHPEHAFIEANFSSVTNSITRIILLHEISHSIHLHLAPGRHIPDGVQALYAWTSRKYAEHPEDRSIIPFHTVWSSVHHQDPHFNRSEYALRNSTEFLAQFISEYIYYTFTENQPNTPADRARRHIMGNFFSAAGLNWNALSRNAITTAYAAEGITII